MPERTRLDGKVSPDEACQVFVNAASAPIFIIDNQLAITYINKAGSKLFGYASDDFLSLKLGAIFSGTDWPGALRHCENNNTYSFETSIIDKHQRDIPIELKVGFIEGQQDYYFCIAKDLSQIHMNQLCQRLISSVALAALGAKTPEQVYRSALESLSRHLHFTMGQVYIPTGEAINGQNELERLATWPYNTSINLPVEAIPLESDIASASRAAQDLTTQVNKHHILAVGVLEKSYIVKNTKIDTSIAIPLASKNHLHAVLQLYWREKQYIPQQLIDTCNKVGRQLGSLLSNQVALDKLSLQTDRLKALVRFSSYGVWCVEISPPVDISLPVGQQLSQIYQRSTVVEANKVAAYRMGKKSLQALLHQKFTDVLDYDIFYSTFRHFVQNKYIQKNKEVDVRGGEVTISMNLFGTIEDGKLAYIWGMGNDITEKKKFEIQAVRLKALIEDSSDSVFCIEFYPPIDTSLDADSQADLICRRGVYVEGNNAAAQRYGLKNIPELIGQPINTFADYAPAWELNKALVLSNYNLIDLETNSLVRSISRIYSYNIRGVIKNKHLTHMWCIARDVTEKKKLEEEYLRRERLEAVRTLAKQIILEGDSKIATLLHSAKLLESDKNNPTRTKEHATQLVSASRGLIELLDELGQFSNTGQAHMTRSITEMDELIAVCASDARSLLRQYPEKTIEVKVSSDKSVKILGNLSELGDIVLNLVKNSIEAMPAGGAIEFKSGCEDNKPFLAISDTGLGMNHEVKIKLYDLYFSTKGSDRGIGLPIILGKMESYAGEITFESIEGEGTTFTLWFPPLESRKHVL